MKRLLAIALLVTSSTTYAITDTYICKPEAQTGLITLENSYLVYNYSRVKKPDTFVITIPTWSTPGEAKVLTLSSTSGEKIYDCRETGETRNGVILCINKWNSMVLRLDITNGKYVQTDLTTTSHNDEYRNIPIPRLEAGQCNLFKR